MVWTEMFASLVQELIGLFVFIQVLTTQAKNSGGLTGVEIVNKLILRVISLWACILFLASHMPRHFKSCFLFVLSKFILKYRQAKKEGKRPPSLTHC